jgi:protein-tyrosine phosphatase
MNLYNKAVYGLLCLTRNKPSLSIINKIANIDDYNMIIPNLYLGNIKAAHDIDFLKTHEIKAIVNCTDKEPFNDEFQESDNNIDSLKSNVNSIDNDDFENHNKNKTKISKFRLSIKDNKNSENIEDFKKSVIDAIVFIEQNLDKNNPVFVHCYWGLMRSATVVAAYLIKKYNISVVDAINIVKEKRPQALSSLYNFNEILYYVENKFVNKV